MKRVNLRKGKEKTGMRGPPKPGNHVRHHIRAFL
jgi:hypothetical protein